MGLLVSCLHSNEECEHALTTASVWHHISAPSLSRHRPSTQLAVLCSSRPFIPSSFHPSIRPCPVIYNSSGILPPSTPLHQDSINILFGPQLRCTHVRMLCVCLRNDSSASPVRLHLELLLLRLCVFVLFWPCLHFSGIVGIRLLVWLAFCCWSLLLVFLLYVHAKSAACPTFWSLCNNSKQSCRMCKRA